MWQPRLVALDIDGTLLDHDGVLPQSVTRAVGRVVAAGVPVVLSTGRGWAGTKPIADALALPAGQHVSSNGAVRVRHPPFEVLERVTFDPAAVVERVLAEHPDNLTACLNLGVALHLSGQHTPAIAQFEHALTLDPHNATAAMNLGAAHAALGHLDRAIAALIRALEAAPAKRDLHYNLAALYLRKGEAARAMAELELELALNPDHALAKQAAEELRKQMLGR